MEKKKGGLLGTLWRTKKVSFFCMLVLLAFIFAAVFADALAPQKMQNGMLQSRLLEAMQAPSLKHPLGTDAMGRDLLSYMLYGARTSVIIGLTCTVLTTAISVVLGASSAVIGGRFDLYLQRVIDAWQCIPGMLVSLILMSMFGSGIPQMVLVLSIPGGIGGSRMIRSAAISVKDSGYCNMSRMMGGGSHWRLWKHVVPNVMPLILMNLANCLGGTIMAESTLSFLGFGVPVNTPDWGALLTAQGRSKMYSAPWIGLAPGIAITLMVFAAAMLGDGLRDVLDPRLKGGMGTFSLKKIHKIAAKYVASLKKEGAKANAKA